MTEAARPGPYALADRMVNELAGGEAGFTMLMAPSPRYLPQSEWEGYETRHRAITAYLEGTLSVFEAALRGERDPFLLQLLINETAASWGLEYHRSLTERHRRIPTFFRTDEAAPGRIVEVQCPGGAWGELELLIDYFTQAGELSSPVPPISRAFVQMLTEHVGEQPLVQHLIDNSSAPVGVRYFIGKTRPAVRYWGYDRGIRLLECNFVRAHSFYSVVGDDYLKLRLERCDEGKLHYDAPPMILFDQKAPMALPFMDETRDAYPDSVREALLYTTLLTPDGVRLPDGEAMSLEQFSRRPKGLRGYYLKYAGGEPSMNFGSRAVYRLDTMGKDQCLAFLEECAAGWPTGRYWVLQEGAHLAEHTEFVSPDTGDLESRTLNAKYSGFYGPGGLLGVLSEHRGHFKVHGQPDTVANLCLPMPVSPRLEGYQAG